MRIRDRLRGAWYGFRHGTRIFQDPLTGALDRKVLEQGFLEKAVAQSIRQLSSVTMVMVDVEDLKQVNDGPGGHSAGDELLKKVSKALSKGVPRKADLVIRCGGDEFLVFLSGTDKEGAQVVMSRIEASLPEGVYISFGICDFVPKTREKEFSLADMIQRADQEMYRNKAANKAERRKMLKGE